MDRILSKKLYSEMQFLENIQLPLQNKSSEN